MEIQPNRAIMPSAANFFRWGLRGGALSTLLPLGYFIFSSGSAEAGAAVLGVGAVIGGAAPALISLLTRRRRDTLGHIEAELERARMMMERRLIDEDDYRRLKSQALEHYQIGGRPARPLWPLALWGALTGAALLGFLFAVSMGSYMFPEIFIATAGTALVGGSVTGGAAQAYAALAEQHQRAQLPAPQQNRRMLGE